MIGGKNVNNSELLDWCLQSIANQLIQLSQNLSKVDKVTAEDMYFTYSVWRSVIHHDSLMAFYPVRV